MIFLQNGLDVCFFSLFVQPALKNLLDLFILQLFEQIIQDRHIDPAPFVVRHLAIDIALLEIIIYRASAAVREVSAVAAAGDGFEA